VLRSARQSVARHAPGVHPAAEDDDGIEAAGGRCDAPAAIERQRTRAYRQRRQHQSRGSEG
jgi:hypothetical protein